MKPNPNGQIIIKGLQGNTNHPFAKPYLLKCEHCSHEYIANSCDVHLRRCPNCQDGAAGLTL